MIRQVRNIELHIDNMILVRIFAHIKEIIRIASVSIIPIQHSMPFIGELYGAVNKLNDLRLAKRKYNNKSRPPRHDLNALPPLPSTSLTQRTELLMKQP